LTSCFLSATRPRKISKDLERSRMSSAMLSCCPMSLGHVTCHIMSHHVTKNHLMSHFIVFRLRNSETPISYPNDPWCCYIWCSMDPINRPPLC
jgi:hypothetical protein